MSNLYRFKRYTDRRQYTLETGLEAPPYNSSLPPKHWEDPSPADLRKLYQSYTVVEMNREGSPVRFNYTDPPRTQILSLRADEAARLNLPDRAITGQLALPPEVPVPIRDLAINERLVFVVFPGTEVKIETP